MSHQLIKFAAYGLLFVLGLGLTHTLTQEQLLEQNKERTARHASALKDYIQSEFGRYSTIVAFLSESTLVQQALKSAQEGNVADRYLSDVQQASGASDIYLLNAEGTVVASSNSHLPHSYKGNNFAFRPYFDRAMAGETVIDFALGQRSMRRGFYFSKAVDFVGGGRGVIALKVNASKFETDKARLDTGEKSHFALLDANEVVLLSDNPDWQLRASKALSAEKQQQVAQSQQFLGQAINPLDWRWLSDQPQFDSQPSGQLITKQRRYLVSSSTLADTSYRLLMLSPIVPFNEVHAARLGLAMLLLLLLIVLIEYLSVKVAGYRQLLFSQRSLEEQVQERTQELEQAQDALIRATKLATIGQLSASVNHEINQPLSAMSAYVAACKRLLMRAEPDKAMENLQLIEQLIRRVHAIAAQLKSFSQKRPVKMQRISLQQSVQNALLVVGPELKKHHVSVQESGLEVPVWVDPYQFEQVLVNLLSNACQAMEHAQDKWLRLEASSKEGKVYLSIIDNGPGIDQHALSTIFEPFYTTKSEHGLGLGLSISKQIIESFQGNLSAHNHHDGGAEFLLSLHQQEPQL
ncbi:sensor histidine kinase [Pseudoalteromonas sp. T1lg88]|uniref:sensor histidine kinase n=1 Tax=Pseudoalteromonas sp. T1lg88 TaxID=2077104 RepID=UPI00131A13F2|nr:ATP-binding protein [Pseudoalteromonas sp. T1lg88]